MAKERLQNELVAIAKAVTEFGPNPNAIAKVINQKKETVRYRYNTFILKRGMMVQAIPDYQRLGLERVVASVTFKPPFSERPQKVVSALDGRAYATGYEKVFMEDRHLLYFAVPAKHITALTGFLSGLQSAGILDLHGTTQYSVSRSNRMKAEYYDFLKQNWSFDFSSGMVKQEPWDSTAGPAELDSTDLLVLKELMVDANTPLTEVSKKLGINYEKLVWHYNKHVKANGLIATHRIGWTMSQYHDDTEKTTLRFHRYIPIAVSIPDVSKQGAGALMASIEGLPFLYFEARGSGYYGLLHVPHELYVDVLKRLTPMMVKCQGATQQLIDYSSAGQFTFSYQLFDQEAKSWVFNHELALESVIKVTNSQARAR
ncbi:MAG: hypothetical protein JRN62_04300 [Nitrososphaerota archaeon]|nr:hypothetical protein [Nitrososphaerota archaeon]MDG6948825.1 hypothetical protein [Nitrososphaerota archaeon]